MPKGEVFGKHDAGKDGDTGPNLRRDPRPTQDTE